MKVLIALLMLVSPLALAENNPRRAPQPTPYNDQRPDNDPLKERNPYNDPDDSIDYQRDSEDDQLSFLNDPRYSGLFCESLLDWR